MRFADITTTRQSCRSYDESRMVEEEKIKAVIEAAKIAKSKGVTVVAVSDFSLEIGDGQLIALLGPSGCGKHTMTKYVAEKFELDLVEIDENGHIHLTG